MKVKGNVSVSIKKNIWNDENDEYLVVLLKKSAYVVSLWSLIVSILAPVILCIYVLETEITISEGKGVCLHS